MPPQIGNIISELVYENKLKSNPLHPVTEDTTACYFVKALGKEKFIGANSYMVLNHFILFYSFFNDTTYLYLSSE